MLADITATVPTLRQGSGSGRSTVPSSQAGKIAAAGHVRDRDKGSWPAELVPAVAEAWRAVQVRRLWLEGLLLLPSCYLPEEGGFRNSFLWLRLE